MHTESVAATNHAHAAGRRYRPAITGAVIALALAGALVVLVWPVRQKGVAATLPVEDELLAAMVRGDARAVERARAVIGGDDHRLLALARRALNDASWSARAAGCELLTGRTDAESVALLLPRVSDADGRVRMLALGAISRVHPPASPLPQKFAFIDDREVWLLAWLEAYAARTHSPLADGICEAYAPAAHVEFGQPLAGRCLSCHAGRSPAAQSVNDACAECHRQIYDQWVHSAHAQSLSHLHLLTPNPSKGQSEWISFGEVHGIGCAECHPVGRRKPPAHPSEGCAYEFPMCGPWEISCKRCHATIDAEWQTWRLRPHPRRPEWPPGQVDLDVTDDHRHCVACHMVRAAADEPHDHRWAARRDPDLLRSAVDVQAAMNADGRSVNLTLTNLAGHAFPAGTRRRAVRVYAGPAGDPTPPLVLALSLDPLDGPGAWATVLAPGERRVIQVLLADDRDALAYRLVLVRDHYNPNSYTAVIMSGSFRRPGAESNFRSPSSDLE